MVAMPLAVIVSTFLLVFPNGEVLRFLGCLRLSFIVFAILMI